MTTGLFGTNSPTPQLQQIRLQPQGTPGSTFIRPAQVQTGGNLRALADALGGLNSALQSYAQVQDAVQDDPNSRANKEWVAKRQQMTIEELRAEAETGTHGGVRVRQDALEGLLGERANADFRQAWATYYNTDFDRANGDVDAEYNRLREEYAEGLPSEVARGNFYRLSDNHREAVITADTEEKLTAAKQQVNATIVDSWHVQIGDAVKAGETDPAKIAQAVIEGSATNATFYGLSGQEQIETVWALAERVALDGNPELAKALLETPRKAADGSTLPAISTLGNYTVKAAKLVESAQGVKQAASDAQSFPVRLDVDRKVAMGEFTAEEAEGLSDALYTPAQKAALVTRSEANKAAILNKTQTDEHKRQLAYHSDQAKFTVKSEVLSLMGEHGGVYKLKDVEIPKADGSGMMTYSKQDQIKDARVYMEGQWADQEKALVAKGTDPAQAKKEMQGVRLAWYEANNVHNEVWADMFAGLPVAANPDVLIKNPAAAAKFVETAELYRDLKARNPAYAETLLTPQSRAFMDSYSMALEFNRMPPEDALAWAVGWRGKAETEKARLRPPAQQVDKIIRDVSEGAGSGVYGESYAIMATKVEAMAALGYTPEAMQTGLEKWTEESTFVINGMVMAAHRDLPQDFPILADMELDRVFAERGEALGLESSDDLFLQPVSGETKWQVWSKSLGGPVGAVFVTPKSLDVQRGAVETERTARQAEMIAASNEDKAAKRQAFDDYVAWERERIAFWREKRGKLGRWAADGWEADLEDYIRNSDPEYVAEQKATKQADERKQARWLAARLGYADPFPNDGELPPDPYYDTHPQFED